LQSLKLKEFSCPLESLFISNPSINQSTFLSKGEKVKKYSLQNFKGDFLSSGIIIQFIFFEESVSA